MFCVYVSALELRARRASLSLIYIDGPQGKPQEETKNNYAQEGPRGTEEATKRNGRFGKPKQPKQSKKQPPGRPWAIDSSSRFIPTDSLTASWELLGPRTPMSGSI